MKRHKHVYEDVCTFENLLLAVRKAQRGKRFTPAAAFNHRLESELPRLQDELQAQTYQPGAYKHFTIKDPKPRLISAAPYRDRIVHHALCNIIEPIFEPVFIFDSYACRKGKGTHAAVDRLTRCMQSNDYALKCDIRQYFLSIDHAILKTLLRRKIGCPRTLWLLDALIDNGIAPEPRQEWNYFAGDDLFTPLSRPTGLPIGNQTSQFFANVYLNPLDHFVKEELRCRAYIRYVDDFVVMGDDPTELWRCRDLIQDFLAASLRLRLHPVKQTVTPVTIGLDFCGYRVFPAHRRLRRSNGLRFARRLRRMQNQYRRGTISQTQVRQRVASWIGHAAHADTYGLRAALLERAAFQRA